MTNPENVGTTSARIETRERLNSEQISKLADLVAQGETSFPDDLDANLVERLIRGVACRRRKWFFKFIAEAIAQEIARSRRKPNGD